jgi:3-hydroxyisobutyrate dehydrogenase-like beta-hydroxyacid dehydrogenase
MVSRLALIGYGEAAEAFAAAGRWQTRAYDIKTGMPETRAAKLADYDRAGVAGTETLAEALAGASHVISLVTADQALDAAAHSARHLHPGALYFDMNSVAPDTKRQAARQIEAKAGRYVDVAVMSPVYPKQLSAPLLVSGPHADAAVAALQALGFSSVRAAGDEVGRASTIKMIRSVIIKGIEALTAESMLAAYKAGVVDEVLHSLGSDWSEKANYNLDRMMVHGLRRAAEIDESADTLQSLGISPMLTEQTADWQQAIGEMAISPVPPGLKEKLTAIVERTT